MASSQSQSNQLTSILTTRCQRKSCPHQECPLRGCSQTCRNLSWCEQCTRFWCDDCWDDVDAHQPVEVEIPGMKVHEKAMHLVFSAGGSRDTETTTEEENAAIPSPRPPTQDRETLVGHQNEGPLLPSVSGAQPQELQDSRLQVTTPLPESTQRALAIPRDEDNAAPRSFDLQQYQFQIRMLEHINKHLQIFTPGEYNTAQGQPSQDYQPQLMRLEQRNKIGVLAAREQNNTTPHPISSQDYLAQMTLLEQVNKKRLLADREQDNAAPQPAGLQGPETQTSLPEQGSKRRRLGARLRNSDTDQRLDSSPKQKDQERDMAS
ncbi:hypothetical protein BDV96DRAFT_583677 [Lophiotrema nucula]|uniref:Uncharacterized protein n=1 Tax=Lophiotrema nucula TaxID=690887 RepID=A0A6A5YUE5_9PLEO|nr:hypothetical protein BDV96DRAFT_583677 [Lophiotrema nucula]